MTRRRTTDSRSAVVAIAAAASAWEPGDWWRLEGRAWAGTKGVPLALARIAPLNTLHAMKPPERPPLLQILMGVWTVLSIVGLIVFHIFGLAHIVGPVLRGDGDVVELGWGGLCFAAAAALIVIGLVASPSTADGGEGEGIIAALYLIPAAVALIAIATAAATRETIHGWIGILGVISGLAIGLVSWFASTRARRRRRTTPLELLDRAVESTSATTRTRVRSDIAAGIAVLAERGLITAAVAERAEAAEPGRLGLTMAPEVARQVAARPAARG
ncbi:hypothetical protein M3G43_16225 [Brevibacterium casei]|uniref:hypothetical protein n=1 Tax=Brevibacterium casei TaxID=33889 RepID=UPI00223B07F9|nr:hypothetical protein [Brevibacterium casei]MCT1448801.1 hypothetical protein [Brevibacterium casei]